MSSLVGKIVLVVEDECLLALELEEALAAARAVVVGPFASMFQARSALDQKLDLAVMNVNVRDGDTYPLAATLRERDIPVIFATGRQMHTEPEKWHSLRWINKPYAIRDVIELLEVALLSDR